MVKLAAGLLLLAGLAFGATRGEEVVLWPGGAPGSEGQTAKELLQPRDATHAYIRLSNIHNPSILVYLPPPGKANGAAVVIAPGGGHSFLAMDVEGYEIVDWLNSHGIAGFILKYRLAREPASHYTVIGNALPDSERAMRLVRSRAKEWGVDPARLGFMGFSAGGELAALMETRFTPGDPAAADPLDRLSSRPDFSLIIYPGFRIDEISSVPADAPPAFLVCANDDVGHAATTTNLYMLLQKARIPVEMHLYGKGGHGFGMRDKGAAVTRWNERLLDWLNDQHLMEKHGT
jgi:endo-1,4-beta-xylanase